MRNIVIIISLLALAACDEGGGCPSIPGEDAGTGADTVSSFDSGSGPMDQIGDEGGAEDSIPETGAPNTAPTFGPLPSVTLDMGTYTTLALANLMEDDEDGDAALTLSWSAEHVALQDGPSHTLMVVAPVDWWGIETVVITLSDSGGLEASADLTVTVNEVTGPVEPPPETCGEVTFSYDDPDATLVELAGSFNGWTPEAMDDGDDDGIWERTLVLAPGPWEYKFVVDGDWKTDPTNPNKVSDGYGEHNSLLEVPPCPED